MKTISAISDQELVGALRRLNISFLLGTHSENSEPVDPLSLITGLAQSNDARLRLALIPLFLKHPEFSKFVPEAAARLHDSARLTLLCYYTAAFCILGEINPNDKQLPDYFSGELNLPLGNGGYEKLRLLAKRHRELSGMAVNWLGTYLHAARFWCSGSTRIQKINQISPV